MEWIETTADTVPAAIDLVLDNLGVDEREADIEVLEEPKTGLFGRVKGQARVRARVKPKAPRPKQERRDRRRSSGKKKGNGAGNGGGNKQSGGDSSESKPQQKPAAAASAPKQDKPRREKKPAAPDKSDTELAGEVNEFLTGLVAAFGLDGDVSVEPVDGDLEATISGNHGVLVGPKGRTLDAIQELSRVTIQKASTSTARVRIDVGDYRDRRRAALVSLAEDVAGRVTESGAPLALQPMSSVDRKVVHDALAAIEGVSSRSDGEDPYRRIVVEVAS